MKKANLEKATCFTAISSVINNFVKKEMYFFITRVSRSLFNFISTIIRGGGFFKISGLVCTKGGSFQIISLGIGKNIDHLYFYYPIFRLI